MGRKPLQGGMERLFVRFRMLRKRALRHTVEQLRRTLEAARSEL